MPDFTRIRLVKLIALVVLNMLLFSSSQASVVTYVDRSEWSAAVGGVPSFFEDFNRFGNRIVDFSRAPSEFQESFSLFSTGLSGASQRVTRSNATSVDGSNHARMFVNADEPTTVQMDFVRPVAAWGADIGRVGDCCERAVADLYFQDHSVAQESILLSDGFIGFVTTNQNAVTSIVFRSGSIVPGPQGQPFGVDNIAGVVAVPEPTYLPMQIVCVSAVVGIGRRRRAVRLGAE